MLLRGRGVLRVHRVERGGDRSCRAHGAGQHPPHHAHDADDAGKGGTLPLGG